MVALVNTLGLSRARSDELTRARTHDALACKLERKKNASTLSQVWRIALEVEDPVKGTTHEQLLYVPQCILHRKDANVRTMYELEQYICDRLGMSGPQPVTC